MRRLQNGPLREQVAACTLLLNDLGLLGYSGHVSARLPGRDALLIQSFDQSRASLKPGDLLVVDFDGKKLAGPADDAAGVRGVPPYGNSARAAGRQLGRAFPPRPDQRLHPWSKA